ncbi:sugar porter family MFS transporter [Streptomyces lavendulae]|uniref:sugar porter family MFS transporter n=1 Tax=Streptomyces lavendulae TaxID=1914 RepID=UPI0036CFCC35
MFRLSGGLSVTADADGHVRSRYAVTAACAASLGGFLFGFDTAVINGGVQAIRTHFHTSALATGLAVSAALLGSALGAMIAGRLADRVGRVRSMIVAAAIFVLTAVGSGLAPSLGALTAWRVAGGIAIGLASVLAPAYIAEISPAAIRGRLGTLQQMAIVLGIFAAILGDYLFATAAGGADQVLGFGLEAWRWMLISAAVPGAVYLLTVLRIPESPRYLIARGRTEQASEVLRRFVGAREAPGRLKEIGRTLTTERAATWSSLRGSALGLAPIVWIGILLSVFQQFVGINVIFYYSSTLWQAVGFSESDALLISVIGAVINVGATVVAIRAVDRVGRKKLLVIGSALMAVTMGVMAGVFATAPVTGGEPHLSGVAAMFALVAANVYVFAFGMSWGPVVWVLLGEMFPNRIRALALAVAAGAQWGANWLVTMSFPALAASSLGAAYGIYTMFAVVSFFFVVAKVRETKNVELEDMEALYARPSPLVGQRLGSSS